MHRRWQIPEREATPESLYFSRRTLLTSAAAATLAGCGKPRIPKGVELTIPKAAPPFPFRRNPKYALDRPLSNELVAAQYNNFYEFSGDKDVWKFINGFRVEPWTIEVTGLVAKPLKLSLDELIRTMPMEERLYRHRCVEAWAMAVPWSGFPLAALLARAEPKHEARFVRFLSFVDRAQMPNVVKEHWYPWPYYEGLRVDEAMNELAFLATGVYGHALPKQHGAPIRLVVPWKYGFKSAKSIVRIELVDSQPATFWEDIAPIEYPFEANVDPRVPHPRWSQASERLIGSFDVRRTQPYNGYGAHVQHLYRR